MIQITIKSKNSEQKFIGDKVCLDKNYFILISLDDKTWSSQLNKNDKIIVEKV